MKPSLALPDADLRSMLARPVNRCFCGQPCHPPTDPYNHFLACNRFMGSSGTDRHDSVKHTVARVMREAGAFVRPEVPTGVGDNKWDLAVVSNGRRVLLDVSCPHVQTPARVASLAALTQGRVVKDCESRKRDHYATELRDLEGSFVPFVIDTFGLWGDEARGFVKYTLTDLTPHIELLTGLNVREFKRYFVEAVSIAVQNGNHRMYMEVHTATLALQTNALR